MKSLIYKIIDKGKKIIGTIKKIEMKDIDFSKEMDIKINEIHQLYTGTYTGFIIQMMNSLSITQINFCYAEWNLNGKNFHLRYLNSIKCNDFTYKLELGCSDSMGNHKTFDFSELSLSDMEYIVRIVVDYTNRMKEAKKMKATIKFSSEFDIDIPKKDALTINDAKKWIDKHWSYLIGQNKKKIINKINYQLTPKKEV